MNKLDEFKQFREGSRIEATKTQQDACKMFIGGIPLETSKQSLFEYLAQFGEIIDLTIKTDQKSGLSRGFGFVLFKDNATVEKVLQVKEHKLDGKIIELKRAKAVELKFTSNKIFVGGVNPHLSEEKIREYFQLFGVIENIELPVCQETNERRSFCFITYANEQPVRRLLQTRYRLIGSRWCEIKLAHPKECEKPQHSRGRQVSFNRLGNRWGERGFAENPDACGANPNVYVANRNAYGANPNDGANPNAYVANPNAYWANPNAYGANPNVYMTNPSVYWANPNAYGANPNVYMTNPNAYGANPNVYMTNPNAYGANPNDYMTNPNAYWANPNAYGANPNAYMANLNAYGATPYGSGANPTVYVANPNAYGANPNGSRANTDVYIHAKPKCFYKS
nr:heterogeneous nuclear ribonucleoprotein D-like [Manis javanica]